MAVLHCAHGEIFSFDSEAEAATYSICAYCCTPFERGKYREHCATSPSHLGELADRAQDRRINRDKAAWLSR